MAAKQDMLVRVGSGTWTAPATTGYGSEAELQQLLASHPALLPGVDADARAVVEFSTRVGPSDVVVVGVSGDITVVECKLASNDEARRKIVGQVFDYASRLWKMPFAEFASRWQQRSGAAFVDWLEPSGLERLEENLTEGRFRLILAVDAISEDLRRLVEYLNAHTLDTVEVLAIELSIAHAGNVDVLVPTVYGAELVAARQQLGGNPNWTVAEVTAWFTANQPDLATAVFDFVERLKISGCILVGTSAQSPSLAVGVDTNAGRVWPYALYTGLPRGSLNINVDYVAKCGTVAQEHFLAAAHEVIPELAADQIRAFGYRRRPGVDPAVLLRIGVVDALVDAASSVASEADPT